MIEYFWVSVEKFGGIFLRLLGMIILARVLEPDDFGIFGMIAIVNVFGQVIIDSGMGGALIHKKNATENDYITVFTFNFIVSSGLFFLLLISSSWISEFYGEESLRKVIPYVALVLVVRAISLVPVTKMTKELNFKIQTKITIVSYVISLTFAYFLAINGAGVMALVVLSLLEATLFTIGVFYFQKYKVEFGFDVKSFKELYSFGMNISVASVLRTIYENLLNIIIGKLYGPQLLGYYYQASKVNDIFVGTVNNIINKASFPVLVRCVDKEDIIEIKMRLLLSNICWVTFIICIFLSINAELIMVTIFGEQWIKSSYILQILSLAGIGMIVEATTRCFLKSHGYADKILRLEVKKRLVGIFSIAISSAYGLSTMLYTYTFMTVIFSIMNMITISNSTSYSFIKQVSDIIKPLVSSIVIYISIMTLSANLTSSLKVFILSSFLFTTYFFVFYKSSPKLRTILNQSVKLKLL